LVLPSAPPACKSNVPPTTRSATIEGSDRAAAPGFPATLRVRAKEGTMADGRHGLPGRILWAILGPVVAAVVLHGALLAAYVAKRGQDPGILVCVAAGRAGRPPFEAIPTGRGRGYDGQWYYAVARAPWRQHLGDLDAPARQLRILYPALCWLVSGGNGRLLLWTMPAVNLAAIAGLAGLGAWLACRQGLNAWWGLLLPLAADSGLPALRNLSDPVSTLAVAALLAAWLVRAPGWAFALAAAGAVFSREQNLAIVAIVVAASLWQGRPRTAAATGAALLPWLAWVGRLTLLYGRWPFLPGRGNFGPPLAGFLDCVCHLAAPGMPRLVTVFCAFALLHLLLLAVLALVQATRKDDLVLRMVLLAGTLLAVVAGHDIYDDFWSYGRVFVWLPVGLWMTGVQSRRRWLLVLLAPGAFGAVAALRGGLM
jgi:hypothetical protein